MDTDLNIDDFMHRVNAGIDDLDTLLARSEETGAISNPDAQADPAPAPDGRADATLTPPQQTLLTACALADVPMKPLTWLWPGWIPTGMFSILGGHVGDGKSTVIAAITAALTTGAPLPDGATTEPANVLFLSTEDDPARVIRPRLEANNADLSSVFMMKTAIHAGTGTAGDVRVGSMSPPDADHLRQLVTAHNIRLVVIDPVSSLLPGSDRATESTIRENLSPLMQLIEDTGVAILGVMRIGKTLRNTRPAQRLVGSSAFSAIARSVIMVARTPVEPGEATAHRAILEVVKSNYARPPHPVALSIRETGAVHWHGPADTGIDEAASSETTELARSEIDSAADFLREYLREEDMSAYAVLKAAKSLGFSEITIRRAKKDAGITSYRTKGLGSYWTWSLPNPDDDGRIT